VPTFSTAQRVCLEHSVCARTLNKYCVLTLCAGFSMFEVLSERALARRRLVVVARSTLADRDAACGGDGDGESGESEAFHG
jgi:hypothetical protein